MKETFYFSHDYNARSDQKIKKLLKNEGWTGYGLYWAIIEDLYQNGNHLELDYEALAYDYRSETETLKTIIENYGLFSFNQNTFSSSSVQRRLNEIQQKRTERREAGRKGGQTKQANLKNGLAMLENNQAKLDKNLAIPENGLPIKRNKRKEINEINKRNKLNENKDLLSGDISQSEISPNPPVENIKSEPKIFEPINIPQDDPEAIRRYLEKMNQFFGSITGEAIQNYVSFFGDNPGMKERVLTEINKARSWLYSNRKNKRKSQFGKFIGNWLNRALENQPPGLIDHAAHVQKSAVQLSPYGRILSQEEIDMLDAQMIKI